MSSSPSSAAKLVAKHVWEGLRLREVYGATETAGYDLAEVLTDGANQPRRTPGWL